MFFAFLQATDTMEDLKRKIQSQEGIPIDPQIILFRNLEKRKTLSLTCPQCKTADKRTLGEFEEFRIALGHSEKLIVPSGYENNDVFEVTAPWLGLKFMSNQKMPNYPMLLSKTWLGKLTK